MISYTLDHIFPSVDIYKLTAITKLVKNDAATQPETLKEGIKFGQIVQALRSLETKGVCRIDKPWVTLHPVELRAVMYIT